MKFTQNKNNLKHRSYSLPIEEKSKNDINQFYFPAIQQNWRQQQFLYKAYENNEGHCNFQFEKQCKEKKDSKYIRNKILMQQQNLHQERNIKLTAEKSPIKCFKYLTPKNQQFLTKKITDSSISTNCSNSQKLSSCEEQFSQLNKNLVSQQAQLIEFTQIQKFKQKQLENNQADQKKTEFNAEYLIPKHKYIIADNLTLNKILQKIYFDYYLYDDIKEYVMPALKHIESIDQFFEEIYVILAKYGEHVKLQLFEILETIIYVDENFEYPMKNENIHKYIIFRKFKKNVKLYIDMFQQLCQQYLILQNSGRELNKIAQLFFDHFVKNSKNIIFDYEKFNDRIFAFFIFNDPFIQSFMKELNKYFQDKQYYARKYPRIFEELQFINKILEKYQTIDNNMLDIDEFLGKQNNENQQEEVILEKLSNQSNEKVEEINNKPQESKKKKKRNKKQNSIQSEQVTDKCTVSKESELKQFEQRLEQIVKESANKQKIKPNLTQEWIRSLAKRKNMRNIK